MFILIPANAVKAVAKIDRLSDLVEYKKIVGALGILHIPAPPLEAADFKLNTRAAAMATKILGEELPFALLGDAVYEVSEELGMQTIAADQLAWGAPQRQEGVEKYLRRLHKEVLYHYLPADYPDREGAAWKVVFKDLGDVLEKLHPETFHDGEVEVTVVELPDPVCSATAEDWHCPPFEDVKLNITERW